MNATVERAFANEISAWTLAALALVSTIAGVLLFGGFDSRTRQVLESESSVARSIVAADRARGTSLARAAASLAAEFEPHDVRFALFDEAGTFVAGDATLRRGGAGGSVLPVLPGQRQVAFVAVAGGYLTLASKPSSNIRNRVAIAVPFVVSVALALAIRILVRRRFARRLATFENARDGERRASDERTRRLLADASHEMRTPIAVLRGYFSVLARGAILDAPLAERILGTMEAEVVRLGNLVDGLLHLARIEGAQARAAIGIVDCGALVAEVLRRPAFARCERLATRIDEAPLRARVDAAELGDAVSNLVDNALKYAPAGAVVVSAVRAGNDVAIAVADLGPGISHDERPHVFDRFYRGSNRGDVVGSGLGLAIVKRVVERAHGTVSIENGEGGGTIVTLSIPESDTP